MSELRASATAASAMLELASPAPAVIAAVTNRGSSLPLPRAAHEPEREARPCGDGCSGDRSDPAHGAGVVRVTENRVEDDEPETRAEREGGDPEREEVDAQPSQVDPSERHRRTGELCEDELGRRQEEEPEHEARLVRRERDELGAVTRVRDVELGDREDEEQHPELGRRRVERARQPLHAEDVDGDRGGSHGGRDDARTGQAAKPAAHIPWRGRSHDTRSTD